MENIETLFRQAFEAGRTVQKKEHTGEVVDGRAVWGELEKKIGDLKDKNLTDESDKNLKYNSSLNDIYEEMDVIIDKYGMDKSEFDPKSNHFFCQLKNLVKAKSNFNIQLNRVMQLGFNAGQLSIFIKKGTLPEDRRDEIATVVEKYNMSDLNTYVSSENQEIINSKYLSGKLEGGGDIYYAKYLKYKNKYLKLSNF